MFNFCSVIGRHSRDSSTLRSVIVKGHNAAPRNFSGFPQITRSLQFDLDFGVVFPFTPSSTLLLVTTNI